MRKKAGIPYPTLSPSLLAGPEIWKGEVHAVKNDSLPIQIPDTHFVQFKEEKLILNYGISFSDQQ